MKKLFLFLCIFSSIFVISCGTKKDNIEVQFKINNNESFDLENFVIFLSEDKSIKTDSTTVEANSAKNISLNMEFAEKKDGSYTIEYVANGTSVSEIRGYYTNGSPLEKEILITIENNSLSWE